MKIRLIELEKNVYFFKKFFQAAIVLKMYSIVSMFKVFSILQVCMNKCSDKGMELKLSAF